MDNQLVGVKFGRSESERMVYMARKVMSLRPDLEPEILAGKMSRNEAHRIATGKAKPTSWNRLVSVWNAATGNSSALPNRGPTHRPAQGG
jgi:hypothetical protein